MHTILACLLTRAFQLERDTIGRKQFGKTPQCTALENTTLDLANQFNYQGMWSLSEVGNRYLTWSAETTRSGTYLMGSNPLIPLLHKSDKLPDCLAKFPSLGFPELPILILHQAPHLQGGFTSLKGFKLRRLITLIPLKLVGCKTSHSIVVNLVSVTSSLYR